MGATPGGNGRFRLMGPDVMSGIEDRGSRILDTQADGYPRVRVMKHYEINENYYEINEKS